MKVGISSFGAWMLGVGSIIGSMAWLMHGPMLARAGPAATLTAWIIAGVMSLPFALILMELSSMFPSAGGPYVYKYYALKRLMPGMGELLGFLTGWLFWIAIISGLACMSNGLVNLLSSALWGSAQSSPLWFGPAVIFSLFGASTALNLLPISGASKISSAFTLLKFAMAFFFAGLVLFSRHEPLTSALSTISPLGDSSFTNNVSSVLMLALAGFSFLELSGCTSSETTEARQTVPRAIFLTILSVMGIYVLMCFSVSLCGPFALSSDATTLVAAGTTAQATCPALTGLILGGSAGQIFTACVVASITGCAFTGLMCLARISYSMAETRLFPRQFTELHNYSGAPWYALLFQFFCVTLIGAGANLLGRTGVFADAYSFMAETYGFMYAFVVILYAVCLVSLRYTDPHMKRPFRIGKAGDSLAWLMALSTTFIWGFAAFACIHWTNQLAGVLLMLAGLPIYFFYRSGNSRLDAITFDTTTQSG